jgi:hypothetical protein
VRVIGRLAAEAAVQTPSARLSAIKPYDVNLWESVPGGQWPESILTPLDATEYGIDPLTLL